MLSAVPENLQSELVSSERLRALYSAGLVWGGGRWGHHTRAHPSDQGMQRRLFQTNQPPEISKKIISYMLGLNLVSGHFVPFRWETNKKVGLMVQTSAFIKCRV